MKKKWIERYVIIQSIVLIGFLGVDRPFFVD